MMIIKNIVVRMYKPKDQDENGIWKENEEEQYNIDKVEFENNNNVNDRLTELERRFGNFMYLLEYRYNYFLRLLGTMSDPKMARKKAGFKNGLLFRMAITNHDILEHQK